MFISYARVSTRVHDNMAQISALAAAVCKKILKEKASGGRWDRPELHRILDQLRADGAVVIWKLDWLPRYLKDLLALLQRIEINGAAFRSGSESIDTTIPDGQ